jgi:hypothetical protein
VLPPNRIVALATPVIAPLAGAFAAWFTQELSGLGIPAEAVEETFLAVTGLVLALALQFNHNRFKWDVLLEPAPAAAGGAPVDDDELLDDELLAFEGELLEGEAELAARNGGGDVAPIR